VNRPVVLINGYLDGVLTDEQFAELVWWLEADKAHAREFAEFVLLEEHIADDLRRQDTALLHDLAALDKGSEDSSMVDITEELRRRDLKRRKKVEHQEQTGFDPTPVRHIVIPKALFYGGIAALLAIAAVLLWPRPPARPPVGDDRPTAPPPVVVAALEASVDAVWADGRRRADHTELLQGDYLLTGGLARIVYPSGAQVTLEAPVRFALDTDKQITLDGGRLVGRCPTRESRGFTVVAPGAKIVDRGTEFGVEVGRGGASELFVFEGAVAVVDPRAGAEAAPQAEVPAGQGRFIQRDGTLAPADSWRVRSKFARSLVPAERYAHLIAASDPLIHYRFDDLASGIERNAAAARYHATIHGKVQSVTEGHRKVFAFSQVGDYLESNEPIAELTGAAAYSIECWVYAERYDFGAICSLTVASSPTGAGTAARVETVGPRGQIGPPNMVRFVHYDVPDSGQEESASGMMGTSAYSAAAYALGRWMHVAAVKSGEQMSLYLDGELFGEAREPANLLEEPLLITIGKFFTTNANRPAQTRQFIGQLDELAIYDHALTPEQVQARVQAGRTLLGY